MSNAVHACMHVFIHVCVQLDIVYGTCMCLCAFMVRRVLSANQIHDVLVNDTLQVGIL